MLFAEEFDQASTSALLAEGRWATGWFGTGVTGSVNDTETAYYDPDLVAVSSGQATFTAGPNATDKKPPGITESRPNLGAQLSTDPDQAPTGFTMSYGYVEARLQQPAGNPTEAVWPGWWLTAHDWPTAMEIDVLEGDGTDTGGGFNIHYGATVGVDSINLNAGPRLATVTGATTGMHTYGADIRSDGVDFYYDQVWVGGYVGAVPDTPRFLMTGLSTAGTLTGSKALIVDYIRAWERTT